MSGFSFLEIGALSALASLAIPLIIHLFNRSRGRMVWIGHVDLVKQAKKIRVTEVKITQWLLLAIRLLIFGLLAFWLAGLLLEKITEVKPKIQLVSPEWIDNATEEEFQNIILNAKAERYFLAHEFSVLPDNWSDAKESANQFLNSAKQPYHLQTLLLAWEAKAIVADEYHVFTLNRSRQFGFSSVALFNEYNFHLKDKKSDIDRMSSPTSVLVIYDSSRELDQKVLSNAFGYLNSVEANQFRVEYKRLKEVEASSEALVADVIIYLSDNPLTNNLEDYILQGGLLIRDGDSTNAVEGLKLITPNNNLIRIFKTNNVNQAPTTEILWRDKKGDALLVAYQRNHMQWLSRFHPGWTDWVGHTSFPQDLAQLLTSQQNSRESRISQNALPITWVSDQKLSNVNSMHNINEWLLLLVCLLWGFERWLAERRFTSNNNDAASLNTVSKAGVQNGEVNNGEVNSA